MRRAIPVIGAILIALAWFGKAQADTEYCPARITELSTRSAPSATYAYRVQALSARTVDATMIADTDRGWYAWSVAASPLVVDYLIAQIGGRAGGFQIAESPPLSVTFPQPLRVRRAWVTAATTAGDKTFGWDKDGSVACDVPDFSDGYALDEVTDHPGRRTPSQAPPAAAAPADAPFPATDCRNPFVPVRLREAIEPEFPANMHLGDYGGRAEARVAVAVDAYGRATDIWFVTSSGLQAFDQATAKAAGESTYAPAISYCRQVGGVFLYTAAFSRGAR